MSLFFCYWQTVKNTVGNVGIEVVYVTFSQHNIVTRTIEVEKEFATQFRQLEMKSFYNK